MEIGSGDISRHILMLKKAVSSGDVEANIAFINQNNQRQKIYKGYMLRTTVDDFQNAIYSSMIIFWVN